MVNSAVILKFIDFINLQYFILKLQHNADISQGSHFLFTFSITFVQINKIDITLTSNLTLILFPNAYPILNPKSDFNRNPNRLRKKCEKQLRNIIVNLLRYVIYCMHMVNNTMRPTLDWCRLFVRV